MSFDELLALLREPGEDGPPPTIYDDLTSSYNLAVEGGASALTEQQAQADEAAANAVAAAAVMQAEIDRLKALNFDLLMSAGTEKEPETETHSESEDEPSIDSLFDKG